MGKKRIYRILVGIPLHTKAGRERFSGILRFASSCPDWALTIVNTSEFLLTPPKKRLQHLTAAAPDGIICATMDVRKTILQSFATRPSPFTDIPLVFLDDSNDASDIGSHIRMDNRAIGSTAAQYFLNRGYRHLAYIGTNNAIESCYDHERRDSFLATAAEQGVDAQSFHFDSDNLDASTLAALTGFLKSLPLPCGLFVYADWLSRSVLDAARLARLQVPGQLALLGVDDEVEICESTVPTLSSICPEFEQAGYQAAALLDQQLRSGNHPHEDISYGIHHFAERESTVDLRGGGRLASAATAYIEKHFTERLTVARLARHLKVSQRLLEIRYREIYGLTVQEAILSRRLAHVRKQLKTTNLPIGEIAAQAGFVRYATLAVLFKRRFGHSLGDERKLAAGTRHPPPISRESRYAPPV